MPLVDWAGTCVLCHDGDVAVRCLDMYAMGGYGLRCGVIKFVASSWASGLPSWRGRALSSVIGC